MLKIILVEDELRTRNGLKAIITKFAQDCEIIGEASNGLEGYELIKTLTPDVVISDIKMPFCGGLEMIHKLRMEGFLTKFILLTGYADFDYARQAISLQVEEYLLKPIVVSDLTALLEKVRHGLTSPKEILSIETSLLNYLSSTCSIEDVKASLLTYPHLLEGTLDMGIIYIPTSLAAKTPTVLLNIKNIVLTYDRHMIVVETSPHTLLLLKEKINSKAILQLLHKHVHTDLGMLTRCLKTLFDLNTFYPSMHEKLPYFLSFGTELPLTLDKPYTFSTVDHYRISPLENKFHTYLYAQKYDNCSKVLEELSTSLQNNNFLPEDILYRFNNLFNALIKHLIDTFKKDLNFNYNKLVKELSLCKTTQEILSLFHQAFNYIANIENKNTSYSLLIQKVLTKIHNEYMYSITLQEVADNVGVTHIYLSTLFHQETGYSFKEYLTDIRMTKAKYLIKNSSLKIYEIASSVGYNDAKHFCTQFKKHTGLSPSHYQNS